MPDSTAAPPGVELSSPTDTPIPTPRAYLIPPEDNRDRQQQPPRPPQAMPPEIATAIIAVTKASSRLDHDGQNKEQGYSFASVDTYLSQVGGWCADAGLAIIPEEVRADILEREKYDKAGRSQGLVRDLHCMYRFWLMHESGVVWMHPLHRRVCLQMHGPQSYGSAESYVLKRFMRGLFKIATGDALDPASDVYDPDGGQGPRMDDGRPYPNRPGSAARRAAFHGPADDDLGLSPGGDSRGDSRGGGQPRRQQRQDDGLGLGGRGQGGREDWREDPAPPPRQPHEPTGGQVPFRVFNGLGEVVSTHDDLRAWGDAIKRYLGQWPASYPSNKAEVDRLAAYFLADPELTDKARVSLETAFSSIRHVATAGASTTPDTTPQDPAREPGEEG